MQDPEEAKMLLKITLFVLFWGVGASENDKHFKMCGSWRHGNGTLSLVYDFGRGCKELSISANESALSVRGEIMAQCEQRKTLVLKQNFAGSTEFCVSWEPLLDLLQLEFHNKNFTLCAAHGIQDYCCTDLSQNSSQNQSSSYGIANGRVKGDMITSKLITTYVFRGATIDCKKAFCEKTEKQSGDVNMTAEPVVRSELHGNGEMLSAQSSVIEMKKDFKGQNITLPAPAHVPQDMAPSVHLPACLKRTGKNSTKVTCTYFNDRTFFQNKTSESRILDDVVSITVENEVIEELPEPVRIRFHHAKIMPNEVRSCVSWDTRRDYKQVWRKDGCNTVQISPQETECCCHHLTYFSILIQLEKTELLDRHLEALTYITALGCSLSVVSCTALFYALCRQRGDKDKSTPVHRGLVVSLFFLSFFFVLAGMLANLVDTGACQVVGAMLHYFLLSCFCWMGVEVFHTFWLVHMVLSATPRPFTWYLLAFGFPVVPVIVQFVLGNIYGRREIRPIDDPSKVYRICWMTDSDAARLAHYIGNVPFLAFVVCCGIVMLYLVLRKIRNRDEWRKNRMTFFSIWGLSCLFGSTWCLAFISFGPLSIIIIYLFCIINSLQGFFLMLRFYLLEWLRKKSADESDISSTGSTRQQMLQTQEQS